MTAVGIARHRNSRGIIEDTCLWIGFPDGAPDAPWSFTSAHNPHGIRWSDTGDTGQDNLTDAGRANVARLAELLRREFGTDLKEVWYHADTFPTLGDMVRVRIARADQMERARQVMKRAMSHAHGNVPFYEAVTMS